MVRMIENGLVLGIATSRNGSTRTVSEDLHFVKIRVDNYADEYLVTA
jgi:hypothetical protein